MPAEATLIDEILDNVNKLTQGYRLSVEQVFDDGSKTVEVEHPSLISQLRRAVSSSMAKTANSVPASERNILDADAIDKLDQIDKTARGLFQSVSSAKPFPTPEQNLRQWFIGYANLIRAGKVSHENIKTRAASIHLLVRMIDDKLNPPTSIEITSPCPRCERLWVRSDDASFSRAITVQSRVAVYGSLDNATATCRGCGATWIHGQGMRQLRWEIDEAETRLSEEQLESENPSAKLKGHSFAMPGNRES